MADREQQVLANPGTDYERSDAAVTPLGVLALAVLAFLVLIPLVLVWTYPETLGDANRARSVVPPAPELQTDPEADLRDFRGKEEARLESYGWVDRGKGIVHIPIEQAMKETAAKGIPDFPKVAP